MSRSPSACNASPDPAAPAASNPQPALAFDDVHIMSPGVNNYSRLLAIILTPDTWWVEFRERVDRALADQRLDPALHARFETVWAVKTLWKLGHEHTWKTVDRMYQGHSVSVFAWCADLLDITQECLDVVRDTPELWKENEQKDKERRETKENKLMEEWEPWMKGAQEREKKRQEETPEEKQGREDRDKAWVCGGG